MRKFTTLASFFLSALLLSACSSDKGSEFDGIPAQDLYNKGLDYLERGDYSNAVRHLEAIDARAAQTNYEQILLSTAYSQYKLGEYHKALDVAERFARTYPHSASMDYAFYLAALSNARLGDNWLQDLFNVGSSARAVENIQNAYGNFQTLIQEYPNSEYYQDAANWMVYLRERMAEHELNIAKFYMKRDAYVAVVNRVDNMLRLYPETKATAQALPLMQKSYEAMNILDSAQQVGELIEKYSQRTYSEIKKPEYPPQF